MKYQKGATLIVVLLILLLVTIIGVLAIRVALTSLNISTNSQVAQLNFQAADTPTNLLLRANPTNIVNISHVLGAALNDTIPQQEYVFCYKPTSSNIFGLTKSSSVIKAGSANSAELVEGAGAGFCDLSSDFGSSRQAVVTQVAVTVPTDPDTAASAGAYLTRGTDVSEGSALPRNMIARQRVRVTTTSMLPAYSSNSISAMTSACMGSATVGGRISDNGDVALSSKQTLAECMAAQGVPVSSQVQEIAVFTYLDQAEAPGS